MPASVDFALVDVFAEEPLSGNPLAVVPDADLIPEHVLPKIAREFNQAETTFLLRPSTPGADWRLRSFTQSGVEVYGAGHNALGAWWWLAAQGNLSDRRHDGRWRQEIGSAVLPVDVRFNDDGSIDVSLHQHPAEFRAELGDADSLADMLGLPRDVLRAADDLPFAQVVWTGAPHLLVGLRSRSDVEAVALDVAAARTLLAKFDAQGIYVYALDPVEADADVHARFFNPVAGIVEDPATGSAAGPLAALLRRHGKAADRVTVVQGHALQRPSKIVVSVADVPTITGRAALTATGRLRLR